MAKFAGSRAPRDPAAAENISPVPPVGSGVAALGGTKVVNLRHQPGHFATAGGQNYPGDEKKAYKIWYIPAKVPHFFHQGEQPSGKITPHGLINPVRPSLKVYPAPLPGKNSCLTAGIF
jgi:hypothetical protein